MAEYCVVYRTGGTENYQWHRSVAMSEAEARQKREETERMGYRAMLVDYRLSMAIGLPEGYDYTEAIKTYNRGKLRRQSEQGSGI
jgi:hypothetical protein